MPLFPDDFPFNRKRDSEPRPEPEIALQPKPEPQTAYEPVPAAPVVQSSPKTIATNIEPPIVPAWPPEPPPLDPLPTSEPAPVPRERRRSPRQAMRARAILKTDTGRGGPVNVEIDNISMLGVRFRSSQPLSLGDRANIRLEVGPLKWATRFRVITCLEDPKRRQQYLIGGQFVGNELARGGRTTAAA